MAKILKIILFIILLIFILLVFLAVIRPEYIKYKQNKKQVVVDTSGERATSRNKEEASELSEENDNSDNDDNENTWKLERKTEYDSYIFDDRILLYEGDITADSTNKLVDILIENIDNTTYTKVDVNINGIDATFEDKENYRSVLNNFKNTISPENNYHVDFEYNSIKTVVDKVIITNR